MPAVSNFVTPHRCRKVKDSSAESGQERFALLIEELGEIVPLSNIEMVRLLSSARSGSSAGLELLTPAEF
jgi:hypothetical protein